MVLAKSTYNIFTLFSQQILDDRLLLTVIGK